MRGPIKTLPLSFSPIDINGSYAKTSLIPTNIQVHMCEKESSNKP